MSENVQDAGPTYRVPRRNGMDPGTRRLAMIAGGLGGALLLVVGVSAIRGHHGGTVPVIEADTTPIRVKPDNPGGMQIAGANDEILSGDSDSQAGKLLPPPETPEPQALRTQSLEASHPAATAPAPAAQATPLAAPVAPEDQEHKPVVTASALGKPVTPPVAGKSTQVQLAAMDTEAQARSEWQRLEHRMPDLLGGRQPAVIKAERDGRTIWRLRTGGFGDVVQATAFCDRVKAKGGGCSIASF